MIRLFPGNSRLCFKSFPQSFPSQSFAHARFIKSQRQVWKLSKPPLTTTTSLNHRPQLSAPTNQQQPQPIRTNTASASTSTSTLPATDPSSTSSSLPRYTPPTTGFISHLPAPLIPYAELIRLDKPTGTYYLFFPCLFSTLLAAPLVQPIPGVSTILTTTALFFTGALVMRGAGCTINDLWDRNHDPLVARTRLRPLARKAITPRNAILFTGGQLLVGLGILLQFPPACLYYGIPSLVLVALYPLAKRVTHYPQFVLGLTFSWGAIMGFPAMGLDLLHDSTALAAAGLLYASNIAWTVLYDVIYAHMDVKDDVGAGIKSIAVKHGAQTKPILSALAVVHIGLLAAAGVAAGSGPVFFIGSCGGAAIALGTMIKKVKLESVKDCWWWFRKGAWFTGGAISAGLFGDYLAQYLGWYKGSGRKMQEGEELALGMAVYGR